MKRIRIIIITLLFALSLPAVPSYARGYYGRMLSGNSLVVYRTLEKAGKSGLQKCTKNKTWVRFSRSVGKSAAFRGMASYIYDHPEYYWANSFSIYGYNGSYSYIRPNYLYYSSIARDFKKVDKELTKAIAYVRTQTGRYNKVKAAHDYLNRRVSYAYGISSGSRYSIAGMIKKNGRKLVCAGYAKAFQAICLANNIPCLYVHGYADSYGSSGESHAWNYVQMADKKWYLVDCTWDDGASISYDYFLKGSRDRNWAGYTMAATHRPVKIGWKWGSVKFKQKLPTLSYSSYQ